MNKAILIGRLTDDPATRYSKDNMAISKYILAVDKFGKDKGANFIGCTAFGKAAEFAESYFHKGMKVAVEGSIETGSYKDQDGKTVYTTTVIVNNQEFCEKKNTTEEPAKTEVPTDFMEIPDGLESELPFN